LVTLDDLRAKASLYRDELGKAGREGPFDICVGPPERPQTCDAEARAIFVDQAGEMAQMGVNWMIVSVPGKSLAEFLDSVAWFGAEVQPAMAQL
jgi:hypothetical protein